MDSFRPSDYRKCSSFSFPLPLAVDLKLYSDHFWLPPLLPMPFLQYILSEKAFPSVFLAPNPSPLTHLAEWPPENVASSKPSAKREEINQYNRNDEAYHFV
jgi:hypothetical protein